MRTKIIEVVAIGMLLCSGAWADEFTFSTNSMTTVLAQGKEHTILNGDAHVTNGDTEITADRIELFGTNFRYAQSSGNVTVHDAKQGITLQADNLFYDRDEDLSRVQGYSEMEDTKNQLVVKGGFMENRGKDNVTIVEIGVRILKVADNKQMACRSEFAEYDRNSDMLELSGTPVVFWKGDEYRASRISINLKTDEIRLEGDVSGKVTSEPGSAGSTSSSSTAPSAGSPSQAAQQSLTPSPAAGSSPPQSAPSPGTGPKP